LCEGVVFGVGIFTVPGELGVGEGIPGGGFGLVKGREPVFGASHQVFLFVVEEGGHAVVEDAATEGGGVAGREAETHGEDAEGIINDGDVKLLEDCFINPALVIPVAVGMTVGKVAFFGKDDAVLFPISDEVGWGVSGWEGWFEGGEVLDNFG